MKTFLFPLLALLLSSCAVAPISNHVTGRANGTGNHLLSVGSTIGAGNHAWIPSIKETIGLTEELDLGFQYEVAQWGFYGKYQLLGENAAKENDGLALAGLAGAGLGWDGFYLFTGPVLSYKIGMFEPYLVERFNYVELPNSNVDVSGVGEVHVDPGTYRYLQHSVGVLIWFKHWFAFGAETSFFSPIRSTFVLKGRERWLYSGQVSFRF